MNYKMSIRNLPVKANKKRFKQKSNNYIRILMEKKISDVQIIQ